MDRNTYSEAAFKQLSTIRNNSKNEDSIILRNRKSGPSGEIYGTISMDYEVDRAIPNVFTYPELGIRIDTNGYDYMMKHLCRSCRPNCGLKHLFGKKVLIALFIVAKEAISPGDMFTLPFNHDWAQSEIPLHCAYHRKEICPVEKRRLQYAEMRTVFRFMGRQNLELFEKSMRQMFLEMDEAGRSHGKIVVSGNNISFEIGKKTFRNNNPKPHTKTECSCPCKKANGTPSTNKPGDNAKDSKPSSQGSRPDLLNGTFMTNLFPFLSKFTSKASVETTPTDFKNN